MWIFIGFVIVIILLTFRKYRSDPEYKQHPGLKIIRAIISVIVILLAGYGLITENFSFQPLMLFFLGLLLLVIGIGELQKGQKPGGYLCMAIGVFISLESFFLS
ncbi:hypothetical protein GCM10010978_04620 [Compostibacillus humi]|uniref:DUF3953 domain-containing protein n=1 Tax=Compostibacillus humi TaxID=1245525 RepID=A0A8J3EIY9_9BACI|nr:DUF3953 domain-containing protein [Compostibacillus humi]GGH70070.1 hypothetical protein GCM10010978_04620 [Compostibacillus humi]